MSKILSEDQILTIIDTHFPRQTCQPDSGLLLGRGDDCAEILPKSALAVSTDLFLEGYHFRRSYFTPEEIGHKALAVNLSDLASAGAQPLGFSLGLMCPPGLEPEWLERVFAGMGQLAAEAGILLTGGDISAAPLLGFSLTVWGVGVCWQNTASAGHSSSHSSSHSAAQAMPAIATLAGEVSKTDSSAATPFLRRGAKAGDILFVVSVGRPAALASSATSSALSSVASSASVANRASSACGASNPPVSEPVFSSLGLARLGLKELEAKGREALADYPHACNALLRPVPQLAAGRRLAELLKPELLKYGRLHCMDVSDGLARDLPRLLGMGKVPNAGQTPETGKVPDAGQTLGADLDLPYESLHPEIRKRYTEQEAMAEAFSGGDDYCLLCACPPELFSHAQTALKTLEPGAHAQVIGKVSPKPGIRWHGRPIDAMFGAKAFDHFG